MLVFYALLVVVLFGMHAVMGTWFSVAFNAGGRVLSFWLPFLFTVLTLAAMGYSSSHFGKLGQAAYWGAYVWFGFVFLGFCASLVFFVLYGLLHLLHAPVRWLGIFSIISLLIIWGLSLWGGLAEPQIKRIPLKIPNMPKLKIAVLSDSHLGMGVSLEQFDKALTKLEEEFPDVLLVLGDVFEFGPNRQDYAARLKKVHTSLGTYGVLGNHEYYVGYEKSKQFYKDAGITLMENETLTLPNRVQLVGVKDIRTARVTPQEVTDLITSLNPNRATIFLSHTPLHAEQAAEAGADLMLSGHTHNGQLWPFNYLVRLQFPRVYGLFDVGDMKLYITSGLFYWGIPLRFFSAAEIPIIEVNL